MGGPPVVAAQQSVALAALGHEVRLVAFDWGAHGDTALNDIEDHGAVACPDLPRQRGRFAAALRREIEWADVCHFHSIWSPTLLFGAATARRMNVPYAVTPHGSLEPWSLAQARTKKRLAMATGFRTAFREASFLHAATKPEAVNIERAVTGAKVLTIPHGVARRPKRASPPPASPGVVLFLGRLHHKKAPERLAAAFSIARRAMPELRLVLAGPDDGSLNTCIACLTPGDLEHTTITGAVVGDDKWDLLASASVFCLPSKQEGFSIAVLEALSAGVPVALTSACNFDSIEHEGAGVLIPGEPQLIAQALIEICTNEERREAMSVAGQRLVAEKYDWYEIGRELADAYELIRPGADEAS